ncbi:MAG: helix-turn-helix domain-containing protein [Thermoanaerobaculia bacterium]|nr:helix-turn-helix domain-containing protein [Thermoanaerobaculia bacterium]
MTLGQRIRRLRLRRGWSQTQTTKKIKIHQKQRSGYDRNSHAPSTDALIRMARVLDCSLDYLDFEYRKDTAGGTQIDTLPEGDKAAVKAFLDPFILENRFQQLLAAGEAARAG